MIKVYHPLRTEFLTDFAENRGFICSLSDYPSILEVRTGFEEYMQFDPHNKIVQLCAEGMNMEGRGELDQAQRLFQQAWDESISDTEKFISAHYVARHQNSVEDKLKWDQIALQFALIVSDENIKGVFPSLYLNIGKCYEDLKETELALNSYKLALAFSKFLSEDGYGNMIKAGIKSGIARAQKPQTDS